MHHGHHRVRSRNRRRRTDGSWEVRARVERFAEPALLFLLADGSAHGYELLDRLPSLTGEERVDVGNVYRMLRGLEEEGFVVSEWRSDLPGPAKRTYTLTNQGRALFVSWLDSLEGLRDGLTVLLDDARRGGDDVQTASPDAMARSEP
ncbi:MAG TPA: helix-turn-helix transcriptional regulator [Gaiellaceae bacterium]|nr:helix-turn-helix transcriptional regulator [Gaiellaceae bacterium]